MSFMDVQGGFGQNNFQNNLAQNSAMNQQNQFAAQQQQANMAAQQAQLNNLYGPQGFGGQTAQFAAAGADFGRGTGYFGDTGASDPGAVQPGGGGLIAPPGGGNGGDVWNYGAPEIPYLYSGSLFGANNGSGIGQGTGMAPGWGGFDNPAVPTSPQQWYANGGYNPYDPATYAPSAGLPGANPMMLGTGSGGYDPQWGGSSIYPQGPQSPPMDWNNWFGEFQGTTGGGANDYTSGGDWEREYLLGNPDLLAAAKAAGRDPISFADEHFKNFGEQEGRGVFDAAAYLRNNPDVAAAGADPFQHYLNYGEAEGREAPMSSAFDPMTYKLLNQDVADAGVDPTAHWLQFGKNEGRLGGFISGEGTLLSDGTFQNTTYRDPWIAGIPEGRRTAETVTAMKNLAQQRGWDPAALAAVIQMETKNSSLAGQKGISPDSLWNPLTETGQYHGLTQMGRGTFDDAGGKLNGLTYDQYMKAPAAQQIATYGAWLDQGAKIPGSAASLVAGGIGNLPPEMQAAIMMGTQFGPNATSWVQGLGEGNMDMRTPPPGRDQAPELKPWTINAMRDAFAAEMAKWPQQQSPWPLQ